MICAIYFNISHIDTIRIRFIMLGPHLHNQFLQHNMQCSCQHLILIIAHSKRPSMLQTINRTLTFIAGKMTQSTI